MQRGRSTRHEERARSTGIEHGAQAQAQGTSTDTEKGHGAQAQGTERGHGYKHRAQSRGWGATDKAFFIHPGFLDASRPIVASLERATETATAKLPVVASVQRANKQSKQASKQQASVEN